MKKDHTTSNSEISDPEITAEGEPKKEVTPDERRRQSRLTLLYGAVFAVVVLVFILIGYLSDSQSERELIHENTLASEKIANLQSSNAHLTSEIEAIKAELNNTKSDLTARLLGAEQDLLEAANYAAGLQMELESRDAVINALTVGNAAQQALIEQLEAKINDLEAILTSMEGDAQNA